MTNVQRLSFRFGLQFHLAVLHFDCIFDRFAAILLADLLGLFLHERGKTVEIAGDGFSRFLLGFGKGRVQLLYLVAFCACIGTLHVDDADLILFLYRPDRYGLQKEEDERMADVIIGKQRNGPTGVIKLTFIPEYASFENRAEPDRVPQPF